LPVKGEVDDTAMRYAEVNQLVFSKASRSAAMVDCVVVSSEMFVASSCQYELSDFEPILAFDIDCIPCKKINDPNATTHIAALETEMRPESSSISLSGKYSLPASTVLGCGPSSGALSSATFVFELIQN